MIELITVKPPAKVTSPVLVAPLLFSFGRGPSFTWIFTAGSEEYQIKSVMLQSDCIGVWKKKKWMDRYTRKHSSTKLYGDNIRKSFIIEVTLHFLCTSFDMPRFTHSVLMMLICITLPFWSGLNVYTTRICYTCVPCWKPSGTLWYLHYTVKCRYNTAQFTTILHMALRLQWQKLIRFMITTDAP